MPTDGGDVLDWGPRKFWVRESLVLGKYFITWSVRYPFVLHWRSVCIVEVKKFVQRAVVGGRVLLSFFCSCCNIPFLGFFFFFHSVAICKLVCFTVFIFVVLTNKSS